MASASATIGTRSISDVAAVTPAILFRTRATDPVVETDVAAGNPSSCPAGAPFCPSKIGDPSTTRSMLM